MYLVDTNIWLELLLEQEKWQEVKFFFENVNALNIHITEFSIYSIGIILSRYRKTGIFRDFITALVYESQVNIIRLKGEDHFIQVCTVHDFMTFCHFSPIDSSRVLDAFWHPYITWETSRCISSVDNLAGLDYKQPSS